MKLHIPTRLRACLMAAIMSVSAAQYNAYGQAPLTVADGTTRNQTTNADFTTITIGDANNTTDTARLVIGDAANPITVTGTELIMHGGSLHVLDDNDSLRINGKMIVSSGTNTISAGQLKDIYVNSAEVESGATLNINGSPLFSDINDPIDLINRGTVNFDNSIIDLVLKKDPTSSSAVYNLTGHTVIDARFIQADVNLTANSHIVLRGGILGGNILGGANTSIEVFASPSFGIAYANANQLQVSEIYFGDNQHVLVLTGGTLTVNVVETVTPTSTSVVGTLKIGANANVEIDADVAHSIVAESDTITVLHHGHSIGGFTSELGATNTDLRLRGAAIVDGDVNINGELAVIADSNLGNAEIKGNLTAEDAVIAHSKRLFVDGDMTISGKTFLEGNNSSFSTLTVGGGTGILTTGELNIRDNSDINANVVITGEVATTLGNGTVISGDYSSANAGHNLTMGAGSTIAHNAGGNAGNLTLAGKLFVTAGSASSLANIAGNATAKSIDLAANAFLTVGGSLSTDSLALGANSTLTAAGIATNNLHVGAGVTITGLTTSIALAGNLVLESNIAADFTGVHDAIIRGTVAAPTVLTGTLDMAGDLVVSNGQVTGAITGDILSAQLTGANLVANNLSVLGDANINGGTNTWGTLSAANIAVSGSAVVDGALETAGNLALNGATLNGAITAGSLSVTGGANTINGAITWHGGVTGNLTMTGGSLAPTAGLAFADIYLSNGSTVTAALTATGTLSVTDASTAAVSGFTKAVLSNATTGALTGSTATTDTLFASAGSSIESISNVESVTLTNTMVTGSILGATTLVDITGGSVGGQIGTGVARPTLVNLSNTSVASSVWGATVNAENSALNTFANVSVALNLTNSTLTGSVELAAADINMSLVDSSIGSITYNNNSLANVIVSGASNIGATFITTNLTVTDGTLTLDNAATVVGDLIITDATIAHNVSGFINASLSNATVGDLAGSADSTDVLIASAGSTIGSITSVENITLTDTVADGDINGFRILTLTDATVGTVTGGTNPTGGGAWGSLTATDSHIGSILNTPFMSVTGGSVDGSIAAPDFASTFVTLVDTTVRGNVWTSMLDTTGVVTITGHLAGGMDALTGDYIAANLNVNEGTLVVRGDAYLGDVVYNNATLTVGGQLSMGNASYTNMSALLGTLTTDGYYTLVNSKVTVTQALSVPGVVASIGGNLNVLQGSTMNVTAGINNQSGELIGGETLVTGMTTVSGNSSFFGSTLTTAGLTISSDSSVTANVSSSAAVTLTAGSTLTGNVTLATSVSLTDSVIAGNVTMSGMLNMTRGSVGAVTNFSGANLIDSTSGVLTGAAAASISATRSDIASIGNGAVNALTNLTLTDTTVGGSANVFMTGALSMTGSSMTQNVLSFVSATLKDSTVATLTGATGASVEANNSYIAALGNMAANALGAVTLNDSTVNSGFAMTGDLIMTDMSMVVGNVDGAANATLTNSNINGRLHLAAGANLMMTNADVNQVTAAGTLGTVRMDNAHAGSEVTLNVETLTMFSESNYRGDLNVTGDAIMDDASIMGNLSVAGEAGLHESAILGNLSGGATGSGTAILSQSLLQGNATDLTSLQVTGGSVRGNIGATGAAVGTVSLTDTVVGVMDSAPIAVYATTMYSTGDVSIYGDLSVADTLTINRGELFVAGDATLNDLIYNNGTLTVSGILTTNGEVTFQNVDSIVTEINHTGNYELHSSSLIVNGEATNNITGSLSLLDNADMIVRANLNVGGVVGVGSSSSLHISGNLEASGMQAVAGSNVIVEGTTDLESGGMGIDSSSVILAGVTSNVGNLLVNSNSSLRSMAGLNGVTNVRVSSSTVDADIVMNGSLSITDDSTVNGNITGTITTATITDSQVDLGEDTANAKNTLTTTGDVTVKDSTLAANVKSGETLTVTDSSIIGNVDANNMNTWGQVNVAGNVNVTENLTINIGELNAAGHTVNVGGTLTFNEGTIVADSVTAGTTVYTDSTVSIKAGDQTINGNFALIGGSLTIVDGNLDVNSVLNGDPGNLTLHTTSLALNSANSTITADGIMSVTDSVITTGSNGSITAESGLYVEDSTIDLDGGMITANGNTLLDGATINADLTVNADTGIIDTVKVESLITEGLLVNENATLSTDYDLNAAGYIEIMGAVSSEHGDISLSGASDATTGTSSSIAADVSALTGDVTLTGEGFDITGAEVSAAGTVTITENTTVNLSGRVLADGESVDMGQLTGEYVEVAGTLNAMEDSALNGMVNLTGTINKTGGDLLSLGTVNAGAAANAGTINVDDMSTLQVSKDSMIGTLDVAGGSDLIVADVARDTDFTDAEFNTDLLGVVNADNIVLGSDNGVVGNSATTAKFDMDLAGGLTGIATDKLSTTNLTIGVEGLDISLRQNDSTDEALISTETRVTIAESTNDILVEGELHAVVDHDFDTLNAHAFVSEDGKRVEILLSENYKGAEGNQNQESTASALETINPNDVKGSVLGQVLSSLGQTMSEVDALRALDDLGARGLAGLNKLVIEGSMNHLQTLRASQKSVNAGLVMNYDFVTGQTLSDEASRAVSLQFTGGNTNISDDQVGGGYNTSSLGFIIVGAQKVTNSWTIGYDFAYSHETGRSADIRLTSDGFYADVNATHTSRRLTQYFSMGAAMYGLDTARDIYIKAVDGYSIAGRAKGTTTAAMLNLSYEATYDFSPREARHSYAGVAVVDASFGTVNGFSETEFGNAGIDANYEDIANLTVGAGMRYRYNFLLRGYAGYVSADALYVVNAGNSDLRVTNRFIGGGNSFEQYGPEASRGGLRLNASANVPITEEWGVFGQATGEFRPDESSFNGSIGVKYSF